MLSKALRGITLTVLLLVSAVTLGPGAEAAPRERPGTARGFELWDLALAPWHAFLAWAGLATPAIEPVPDQPRRLVNAWSKAGPEIDPIGLIEPDPNLGNAVDPPPPGHP